jgi:uncharacterized membrane protein YuzA (DUF378 family)
MGLGLLGLSWYNCDSGLELFAKRYGENKDLSGAFWGVIGGLAGLICILYAVQIARRYTLYTYIDFRFHQRVTIDNNTSHITK